MRDFTFALVSALTLAACSGSPAPGPATGGPAPTASGAPLASLDGRWRCDYEERGRTRQMTLWIESARARLFACPGLGRYECTDAWRMEQVGEEWVARSAQQPGGDSTLRLSIQGARSLAGVGARADRPERVALSCTFDSPAPPAPPDGQEVNASAYRVPQEVVVTLDYLFGAVRNHLIANHAAPEGSARVVSAEEAALPVGSPVPAEPTCDGTGEALVTDAGDTWYERIEFMPGRVRGSYQVVLGEVPGTFRLLARWDDDCDGEYATFVREVGFADDGLPEPGSLLVVDPYE